MPTDGSLVTTMSAPAPAPAPAAAPAPSPAPNAAPVPAPAPSPASQPGAPPVPTPEPAAYTDFTFPEGVEKDEALLNAFTPVAKELGLKQEQAQKLVTLQAAHAKAHADAQAKAWETTMTEWQTTARQDQEYGGVKFDENLKVASDAVKKYGSPELTKALEQTGLGNHPEMVRFAYRVGKAMREGSVVPGATPPAGDVDPAKVMFPNMA